ncbi:MAG TPA: hypothetical protein VHX39_37355 [Acetobacteraceae bacterium]|nr:hypothetical protein [Acetobacteraceae bacterium]
MTPSAEQQVLDEASRLARSAVRPKCYEGVGGVRHLQCGIGSIAVVDHIEPAQIGRMWQFRQALQHRGFDGVARLPRASSSLVTSLASAPLNPSGTSGGSALKSSPVI